MGHSGSYGGQSGMSFLKRLFGSRSDAKPREQEKASGSKPTPMDTSAPPGPEVGPYSYRGFTFSYGVDAPFSPLCDDKGIVRGIWYDDPKGYNDRVANLEVVVHARKTGLTVLESDIATTIEGGLGGVEELQDPRGAILWFASARELLDAKPGVLEVSEEGELPRSEALALIGTGDLAAANALLEAARVTLDRAAEAEALVLRADCLARAGQYFEALTAAERALQAARWARAESAEAAALRVHTSAKEALRQKNSALGSRGRAAGAAPRAGAESPKPTPKAETPPKPARRPEASPPEGKSPWSTLNDIAKDRPEGPPRGRGRKK